MDKAEIIRAISELKKSSQKKFAQSYDLIINLKALDIKSNPVDVSITLPFPKGKAIKVAAFVDQELAEQAQKHCQLVLRETDFPKYAADKKLAKKLAEDYDYFIAQMNLMPKVAAAFGRTLGTKGKMPNPKLGCVVPANANLEMLVKKLGLTARIQAKKGTNLQCIVGKQDQPDEQVAENILAICHAVEKALPGERQNIKNILLKLTMSKPVRL